MRALQLIRLYALAVLFLIVAGGIVLKPGARQPSQPAQARAIAEAPVVVAGLAP